MKTFRMIALGAALLGAAACSEETEPDISPYAGGEGERTDQEAPVAPEASGAAASELDRAAEAACRAGASGFAEAIPMGSSVASRAADEHVYIGCAVDGARREWTIPAADLPTASRTAFDSVVTGHFQRGVMPGSDSSGTGVYEMDDGRICVVQTDPMLVRALCSAGEGAASVLADG
jgi:hypothetical protein